MLEYGLCIWSTGVGPTPFIQSLPLVKTSLGRIAVDKHLRVTELPRQGEDGWARAEGGASDAAAQSNLAKVGSGAGY